MASLKDAAERQAFSLAIDATLKSLNKDREKGLLNIVNLAQKFMGSNFRSEAYEGAKKMIQNPDSKWMRYVNRLLDETDPHVAKMTALNLGYQAAFAGTKKIRKMREIENCNIPWLILMDPTSACNLHDPDRGALKFRAFVQGSFPRRVFCHSSSMKNRKSLKFHT